MIGNHIFRKRRQLKNRSVIFTYNGCEAMAPKTYLSAIARIIEDGTNELVEWPRLKSHRCWADGSQAHHRKALDEMLSKVTQDPTCSAQSVYEEVRNSFTEGAQGEQGDGQEGCFHHSLPQNQAQGERGDGQEGRYHHSIPRKLAQGEQAGDH